MPKRSELQQLLDKLEAKRAEIDRTIQDLRDFQQAKLKPKKPRAVKPRIAAVE